MAPWKPALFLNSTTFITFSQAGITAAGELLVHTTYELDALPR
jgi:hypothetical protein